MSSTMARRPRKTTAMTTCNLISHQGDKTLSEIIDKTTLILDGEYEECDIDEPDESDSPSSSTSGPQRALTFAPTNKYFEIMSLEDYSEKELRRCWYTPEEKEKMNKSKDKLVARLETGKPLKGDMTYRGLECWTVDGGQELDDNIARVVDAVMDEQDRQWAEDDDNFELIAEISQGASAGSAELARSLAIQDEKEAKSACDSMEETSVASMHSSTSVDMPTKSRKHIFGAFRRQGSDKSKKRSSQKPKKNSTKDKEVPVVSEDESNKKKPTKDKRRKSKDSQRKTSKKDSKKSRRSHVDPRTPVKRTASQDASDSLLKMRAASRHLQSMKV